VRIEPGLALLHRARLLAALAAVIEVLLAKHADGAGGPDIGTNWGLLLGVPSACAKILRASSSELARRSTRLHGSPSPAGARNMTWYFVPPASGA
jgi:hypothetical protein